MKDFSPEIQDEFLSAEDLDLAHLTKEELILQWNQWLLQAQSTNQEDADTYSHGVFIDFTPPARQMKRG